MLEKIKETANYIKNIIQDTPDYAVVLGSGLGKLRHEIKALHTIPYQDIPNFPQVTVQGHVGELIYGILEGKKVLMMSGRFHYYEGYTMQEVTFPMRVFSVLGIKNLLLSNASGGVNPGYHVGDIVLIKDHINMMPEHPLRGKNIEELGPRFVDMSEPYNLKMIETAKNTAKAHNIKVQEGVYMSLQGPTFETPHEYGMVRILGADCVGMSTVPEIIVGKHMDMNCFCISIITDLGGSEMAEAVSHEEVLNAANQAMPNVITIVKGLIKDFQ